MILYRQINNANHYIDSNIIDFDLIIINQQELFMKLLKLTNL